MTRKRKVIFVAFLAIALLGLWVTRFYGPEPLADRARAVLDRAIKAHGGEAALKRSLRGRIKALVTMNLHTSKSYAVELTELFDLPRSFYRRVKGAIPGDESQIEYWIRSGDGRMRRNGVVSEFAVRSDQTSWHNDLWLLIALRDTDQLLYFIPEQKFEGRRVVGFRYEFGDGRLTRMFDSETGLLSHNHAAGTMTNPLTGQPMDGDLLFQNYQTIQGITLPMRLVCRSRDKTLFQIDVENAQFLESIGEAEFGWPDLR